MRVCVGVRAHTHTHTHIKINKAIDTALRKIIPLKAVSTSSQPVESLGEDT